jgi:hypothetical protein
MSISLFPSEHRIVDSSILTDYLTLLLRLQYLWQFEI